MCAQTTGQQHKMGRPRRRAATPRPRRARAPCPRRSHSCAAQGVLQPRSAATPGRAATEVTRAPQRAGVRARATRWRTTHVVPAGRALLRSSGPSATSRPRAPYHGRSIMPSSPPAGPFPYLRARPSSSRRPTSLLPFSRAAVAAAGKPLPCIASGPPHA
jgi:hypothetical protein